MIFPAVELHFIGDLPMTVKAPFHRGFQWDFQAVCLRKKVRAPGHLWGANFRRRAPKNAEVCRPATPRKENRTNGNLETMSRYVENINYTILAPALTSSIGEIALIWEVNPVAQSKLKCTNCCKPLRLHEALLISGGARRPRK